MNIEKSLFYSEIYGECAVEVAENLISVVFDDYELEAADAERVMIEFLNLYLGGSYELKPAKEIDFAFVSEISINK